MDAWRTVVGVLLVLSFGRTAYGQLCSSPNGLGKCSSNVFTCVFQNGYPQYFKSNDSYGDCTKDQFCCVNLPLPEDGSCSQRCGVSGTIRQKTDSKIKLDKNYDWNLMLQAQERSSRIVNGSMTDKYEFCWQGGVFIVDTEQLMNNTGAAVPIYIGGASLVAQDMALTAAHVLQPFITDANFIIFVAFGFRKLSDVMDIMNGSAHWDEVPVFRVPNEMAFHSGYNDRTYENNIAIIRFNPISCENPNVCPICLSSVPANPFQPWKGTCYASGWGATANASVSSTLQKLEMNIPYPQECLKSFMKLGLKNYDMPSTMLCADSVTNNGGTCDVFLQRDGGSPLVCQTKYGNWELTGIVGVGINRCRQIDAPTLFTNVGYYYDWISSYSKGTYRDDTTTTSLPDTSNATTTTSTVSSLEAMFAVTPFAVPSTAPSTTSTASSTLPSLASVTTSTRAIVPFQFNTPKVFIPKQPLVYDERKKINQAFFQERADTATPNNTTAKATTESATTTSGPSDSTFAVVLENLDKTPNDIVSNNAGGIRLFLKAENNLFRRKINDFIDSRNAVILVNTSLDTTEISTTKLTTSPRISSATLRTAKPTTAKPTTLSSVAPPPASSPSSTTTASIAPVTPPKISENFDKSSSNEIPTPGPLKSWSELGKNKVVVFVRPDNNTSIMHYLRRRYKDSRLYTDSPTTTGAPSNTTTVSTKTPSTVKTAVATVARPSTSKPSVSSTPKRYIITFAPKFITKSMGNMTLMQHIEVLAERPTGPSVMLR